MPLSASVHSFSHSAHAWVRVMYRIVYYVVFTRQKIYTRNAERHMEPVRLQQNLAARMLHFCWSFSIDYRTFIITARVNRPVSCDTQIKKISKIKSIAKCWHLYWYRSPKSQRFSFLVWRKWSENKQLIREPSNVCPALTIHKKTNINFHRYQLFLFKVEKTQNWKSTC